MTGMIFQTRSSQLLYLFTIKVICLHNKESFFWQLIGRILSWKSFL